MKKGKIDERYTDHRIRRDHQGLLATGNNNRFLMDYLHGVLLQPHNHLQWYRPRLQDVIPPVVQYAVSLTGHSGQMVEPPEMV